MSGERSLSYFTWIRILGQKDGWRHSPFWRSHFFASPCCSPLASQDLARFHAYQSGLCGVIAIISLYVLRHWFGWYTLSIICGMGALGASWVAGYVARVNRNGDRSKRKAHTHRLTFWEHPLQIECSQSCTNTGEDTVPTPSRPVSSLRSFPFEFYHLY